MKKSISEFLALLKSSCPSNHVFNPWQDFDEINETSSRGAEIRTRHLQYYLESRINTAKLLLIGEAVGYQGGHFSGLAMTSERILLGYQKDKGIYPEHVLPNLVPQRTSKPDKMPKGFTEPTATIVWGALLKSHMKPEEFVLWNTFAWHPFAPNRGYLSNRRPKASELATGEAVLETFLRLFPKAAVVAVGRVAAEILNRFEIEFTPVRHPAQGGAVKFRNQIRKLLGMSLS